MISSRRGDVNCTCCSPRSVVIIYTQIFRIIYNIIMFPNHLLQRGPISDSNLFSAIIFERPRVYYNIYLHLIVNSCKITLFQFRCDFSAIIFNYLILYARLLIPRIIFRLEQNIILRAPINHNIIILYIYRVLQSFNRAQII